MQHHSQHLYGQLIAAILDVEAGLTRLKAMLADMDVEPDAGIIGRLHDLGVRAATAGDIAAGRATTLVVGWPQSEDQDGPIGPVEKVDDHALP